MNCNHRGASIDRTGDRIRFHPAEGQDRRSSGRTSRTIGARCPSRDNFGGADERGTIFSDLIFVWLWLAFLFCLL